LCICTGLKEKAFDSLVSLPDTATMEEVLRMVVKERGCTEERWRLHLERIAEKEIDTVGDLRVLSEGDIKELGLPPVVARYLLRTRACGDQ
jgi:Fe-S cluster assembly iron-binding protein IscA